MDDGDLDKHMKKMQLANGLDLESLVQENHCNVAKCTDSCCTAASVGVAEATTVRLVDQSVNNVAKGHQTMS